MIGRLRSVVLDCPDPRALAAFYAELLGLPLDDEGTSGDEWVVISGSGHRLAFQQAPTLRPPTWPDPAVPQQLHLDIDVEDIETAEKQVLALGARALPGGGDDFRVYADPAGHPFCLTFDA